ncbi:cysteine proteinase [Hymenopellis radicata]|nr:cysteine proteinase [Hymenopellis radicata]
MPVNVPSHGKPAYNLPEDPPPTRFNFQTPNVASRPMRGKPIRSFPERRSPASSSRDNHLLKKRRRLRNIVASDEEEDGPVVLVGHPKGQHADAPLENIKLVDPVATSTPAPTDSPSPSLDSLDRPGDTSVENIELVDPVVTPTPAPTDSPSPSLDSLDRPGDTSVENIDPVATSTPAPTDSPSPSLDSLDRPGDTSVENIELVDPVATSTPAPTDSPSPSLDSLDRPGDTSVENIELVDPVVSPSLLDDLEISESVESEPKPSTGDSRFLKSLKAATIRSEPFGVAPLIISAHLLEIISLHPPCNSQDLGYIDAIQVQSAHTHSLMRYLTIQDLQRLLPRKWLNDEIMNAYIGCIGHGPKGSNADGILCLDTFFATQYLHDSKTDMPIDKLDAEQVNILRHRFASQKWNLLTIPVNKRFDQHWFLVCVWQDSHSIIVYDSLSPTQSYAKKLCTSIQILLRDVFELSQDAWTTDIYPSCPKQLNGYDCGVFSLMILNRILFTRKPLQERGKDHIHNLLSLPQYSLAFRIEILSTLAHSMFE